MADDAIVKPSGFQDRVKLDGEYSYESFSGVDIIAEILLPNEPKPLTLGELQTISYSMHRESKPVRILGRVNPRGFVRGARTIAGSMIFTVFNTYAFYRLEQYKNLVYGAETNSQRMYPLADMLPPFDIVMTLANEYGKFARQRIYGVTIIDEGETMSVDDLIIEQTYTFVARGIQPLTAYVPDASSPVPSQFGPVATKNSIGFLTPTVVGL